MQVSFHIPEVVVIRVAIPSSAQLPIFAKTSDRPAYIPQSVKAIFLNMETAYSRWYHILTDWPGAVSENSVQIWADEFHKEAHKCSPITKEDIGFKSYSLE